MANLIRRHFDTKSFGLGTTYFLICNTKKKKQIGDLSLARNVNFARGTVRRRVLSRRLLSSKVGGADRSPRRGTGQRSHSVSGRAESGAYITGYVTAGGLAFVRGLIYYSGVATERNITSQ